MGKRSLHIPLRTSLRFICQTKIAPRSQRNAWEITLRTLSSNQPHPDASSPSLIYTTNDQDTWMVFTISVLEDQLAVMFSPYDGPDPLNVAQGGELVVWNWKTGQVRTVRHSSSACSLTLTSIYFQILRGPFKYPTSFTFISPNVFIVGEVEARQSSFLNPNDRRIHFRAALVVYAIPHQESNHETQVECQKVASFHLPLFKHDVHDVRLSSRSDPAPVPQRWPSAAPPASGNFKPFYMNPLKRVIVLSVDLTLRRRSLFGSGGVGHREYTVFVHTDMFTNLLGEQRVSSGKGFSEPVLEFNWKQWQRFARWTTLQRSPGHYGMENSRIASWYLVSTNIKILSFRGPSKSVTSTVKDTSTTSTAPSSAACISGTSTQASADQTASFQNRPTCQHAHHSIVTTGSTSKLHTSTPTEISQYLARQRGWTRSDLAFRR